MNRKNGFVSRFFNFIYKGQVERNLRTIEAYQSEIERHQEGETIEDSSQSAQQKTKPVLKEKVVSQIILNINKILTFVCIGSFIVMIVYAFVYPDKPIPDIIQNAFFTTLGWFGSAFASFFQIDKEITKS